jgi:hypothetical protein
MPGIYVLKCDRCDFNVGPHITSLTFAVKDDGTEVVCPHPCERWAAEEATGKDWRVLVDEQRLRYRYGLICLNCGEFGYYGPDQLRNPPVGFTDIGNIVHHPSSSEARYYTCNSCGKKALYPVCGDTGCLLGLLNLVGLFRKKTACPRCKDGSISSEMVAIS